MTTTTNASALTAKDILGEHPQAPNFFGEWLQATDNAEQGRVIHRALLVQPNSGYNPLPAIREHIIKHHASADKMQRLKNQKEALIRQGYTQAARAIKAFPQADKTRKGNAAEIILAEYLASQPNIEIPVYKLRYNPNIEQSMKGDDVLAFDFKHNPVRLIIGESKYRATPADAVLGEMTEALIASNRSGMPASLEFVAERLYEAGNNQLADRVSTCTRLFAEGKLELNYTGLLMSNAKASTYAQRTTATSLQRLVVISLGLSQPDTLISDCYANLE